MFLFLPLANFLIRTRDGVGLDDCGCVGFDDFFGDAGLFFDFSVLGDCLAGVCLTSAGGSCTLGCGLLVADGDILPGNDLALVKRRTVVCWCARRRSRRNRSLAIVAGRQLALLAASGEKGD